MDKREREMASRTISAEEHPRGAAVVGAKKQMAAGNGGRNRRILADIGNVVTVPGVDGKPAQISRPLTRGFCQQLLANAQAAAAAEKKKKQAVLDKPPVPLPDAAAAGKKTQAVRVNNKPKKAPLKPKPAEVIDISPDTDEQFKSVKKQEKPRSKKKEVEGSSKKKTLTSVLTARSKAACALANKPKVDIVDIDAPDAGNDLAGVEYLEDIYRFYKEVENESRPNNYMASQPEINEKMRSILVDWLIDVHHKFDLSPETLYLTINIVDRFLSVKTVSRRELQLVGMSATLIASKYEEIWAPEVNDLVCISDRAFFHEQVLKMEKTILKELEWTLTLPTYYVFLARFIKASIPDKDTENMVYYLAELGLMHYDTIMFCPSMVAASAVYAARCTLNKSPSWTETLKLHTGYSESQLKDCASILVYLQSVASQNKLQTVYRKYLNPQRRAVALLPHSKSLLPPCLRQ